jgi:hypothetical protein
MLEMPDLIREWKKVSTPFGPILALLWPGF